MYETDFLIIFILLSTLFVRHILVYKQSEKINYAPLEISIAIIGSIVHFLLHSDVKEHYILLQESMLLVLTGFIFFMIMNILHQTLRKNQEKITEQKERVLNTKIDTLSDTILSMQEKMIHLNRHEISNQKSLQESFTFGSKDLTKVQNNQEVFMDKFESLLEKQESVIHSFETFTSEQMPELDTIVHRHIEMLRIAETDHFNKIKTLIQESTQGSCNFQSELKLLSDQILGMEKTVVANVSSGITREVNAILNVFEKELNNLRSQSGAITTSMSENEQVASSVRAESELLLKQMLLMSKRMQELVGNSDTLNDVFEPLSMLVSKVATIKEDYTHSQREMDMIVDSLKNIDELHYEKMRVQIDELTETLTHKIEHSLDKLQEHYHIAERDISKTVQELSTKAKMQQSYND